MSLLEADSIELRYGSRPLLRGVYLRVAVGEVVGLLGRNGCGKSSLLRVVAGHQPAQNQSVRIDRQYLAPARRAASIRYLPQHPLTPGGMRVAQAFEVYGADYARLQELIRDETRRKGILLADHRYRYLLDGCDRLYFLSQGGRTQALTGDARQQLVELGYLPG